MSSNILRCNLENIPKQSHLIYLHTTHSIKLHGATEDQSGGQLQAHSTSHHQVQHMPGWCSVPTAVLHRSEPAQPSHEQDCLQISTTKWDNHQPPGKIQGAGCAKKPL